jgi:hypothetical protein
MEKTISKEDECLELKNIKYKTMLMSGNQIDETQSSDNLSNLDKFLEQEKNYNKCEPWTKLDKTMKLKKIAEYADQYQSEKSISNEEKSQLIDFLKDSLNRKKLMRVKEVIYDKNTGMIKDIPGLHYNKSHNRYTLKVIDKRVNTLKSLSVKKKSSVKTSVKNKITQVVDSDEEPMV